MTPLFASLTFASWHWLGPMIGALVVALGLLGWSYRAVPPGPGRWFCATLKAAAAAALAFCLLDPLWSGQRAKPGANLFAVVADNSQGLRIHDQGESKNRGEKLRELLRPDPKSFLIALEDNFEVRRYLFDSRLQGTRDFAELDFSGQASAIGEALRTVRERLAGRPLAGILLLTDGNATDWRTVPSDLSGLPPVYPVVLGQPGAIRDLAVSQVHLSQTAFEDAPLSLQAEVTATGLRGQTVLAQLRETSGQVLEERSQTARKDEDSLTFRFQWRPQRPGWSFYEFRVTTGKPGQDNTPSPESPEATLVNNRRLLAVDRGQGPYRILYLAGRPNWEYKFLNRALAEDEQLQLVALIRMARREPKFEFRGRAGETSNPLYRGFGDQSREEVDRYDQPVLVRLNTRDELELRGGFPRTPEELYGYHAVIIDDLEAEFFAPDQAALLQKFVAERGGGFLMLGGMECYQQGQYARTPIASLLPVYLDRPTPQTPAAGWQFNLAREGWLQAWVRLRDNEADERSRLQGMPPFQVLNTLTEIKPGASVLATATDGQGHEFPALVTQRFGRGRTAALTIGDLWRWGMRDQDCRRDLNKCWRQLARWLVSDVPQRVDFVIETTPTNAPGLAPLQVRVRDEKFQPLDDASVTIQIRPATTENPNDTNSVLRLRAEPATREAGLYETTYLSHQSGAWLATALVTNAAGAEIGRAQTGWTTDLAAEEFRSLRPNTALLETIAQRTGGQIIPATRLTEFVQNLPRRQAPIMEAWTTPAWHTPTWFVFALSCLVTEWGFRRWKGWP